MKKITTLLFLSLAIAAVSYGQEIEDDAFPVDLKPGECYIRCITPERYGTSEKRITARPTYKRLEKTRAEYKTIEEEITVKPASKRYVYVPPEYRTVTEEIEIEEPYNEITIQQAKFGVKAEVVETRPKVTKLEYQSAYDECGGKDPRDCMVLCAVEHPAEYQTYAVQTIESKASYIKSPKGGKTMTLSRQELVKAATIDSVDIPAEFKTITKRVLIKDEEVIETEIPEEFEMVTVTTLEEVGGKIKLEKIDCGLVDYNVLPILYDFGSSRLTNNSKEIIDDKLLKLMRDRPSIRVELSSHTDSRGSKEANQALS